MERGQEMASKVKSLDETISGLKQELNAIAHSNRSADLGKKEISENLEESTRQVESLQREVSKVTAEHEQELDATKVCTRDLETAQSEVNLKEKELIRLKEDLRASEHELAAAQKEIASGITAEKQQIEDVRSEEAQLSQEKSTLDLELSQTRTVLDKEADDLSKVLAEKARLQQEFSKLQTSDETLKERLRQARSLQEEQVAGEDEKLKTALTQKRNSMDNIAALTSKCAELQRQIADMEAEKVKRSEDLMEFKSAERFTFSASISAICL
jgi:chromosome segregation ATPase